jgi:carboxyl-terminal processing protease
MNRWIRALIATAAVTLLVAGAFLGGVLYTELGGTVPPVAGIGTVAGTDAGTLVDEVDRLIQRNALVPSSETSVTTGAIDGMLSSLEDTYAVYYSPSDYAFLQDTQRGSFAGIGIALSLDASGQPTAARVFPDSPASRAGLKAGDVFTAVGSVRKAKWDLDQFVALVRGPAGTKVTLEVTRAKRAPFTVTLTRAIITTPNTITKMYGNVGYVHLLTFNERSAADLATAIKGFDAKGAKGYVFDLRQNPGGLLTSAVDVLSLFVKQGVAVRVDERGKPEEVDSVNGGQITTKPVVLLVDGGSASASEIVAGALKDYKRVTIVGQLTYGKGSVQSVQPLSNGGAVKMTIAHYLTPLRNVINHVGVTPDVVVKMDPMLQLDEKKDTQLAKALAVLRSKL